MIVQPTDGLERLAAVVRAETEKPETRHKVETRIREFQTAQGEGDERWFEELVFCLLTANYSARGALACIAALNEGDAIGEGSLEQLRMCLEHRHRFPNKRAEFIHKAREHKGDLKRTITSQPSSRAARDWLVDNITGLGMKEASHFLRNVGYLDLAIIDKHILTHMLEQGIIAERPKTLTRKKYLEYEAILTRVAARLSMPLGMMDLYLWAKKSGEVIK
ncbi:MAG: N-glycosylase/DNA lyase [Candidatus Bathyarchaeota archaeon]|nr:N-glycosylase/DNA lyase [Candidatus Bathyarchaeota archaeon]